MTHRSLPAVGVLLLAVALTAGCGSDDADRPNAAPPASSLPSQDATGLPSAPPPPSGPGGSATTPATPAQPAPAQPAPPQQGTTERRPASPPPVVLPPRPAGAPAAQQVVDAFRAAGLKVTRPKDRSVDCGPDGLGLGCSEIVATDAVTIYVFPDEVSASDIAETWSGQSYQRGAVVLNYLEAKTPAADRPRYEKALNNLR
ncbi:hypothetical protein [Micromonospora profundi]|uniref:Lipoprotein n=1 Tax=Micromonospora profundi TaxID=1420889 RepID=A0AAJ6HT38_9ACTN|nr:hypothetical protein [Micromonospora profundi]WLS45642.1 hypothetical protein Q3V37_30615 [Micromonospora profundi]